MGQAMKAVARPCACGGFIDPDLSIHDETCQVFLTRTNLDRMQVQDLRRLREAGIDVAPLFLRGGNKPRWYGRLGVETLWRASGLYYCAGMRQPELPASLHNVLVEALHPNRTDGLEDALDFALSDFTLPRGNPIHEAIDLWLEHTCRFFKTVEGGPRMEYHLRQARAWVASQFELEHKRGVAYR